MSEGSKTALPDEFQLPPSVVSRIDVAHLVSELEAVDGEMTTNGVREKIGEQDKALPDMSERLADFIELNKIDLTDSTQRSELVRRLRRLKDTVPVVHMTFAVEADRESLERLAQWLRQAVHPQAVIATGVQPALVAGVYVRTTNHVFDCSLRGALQQGLPVLEKELGALRESV